MASARESWALTVPCAMPSHARSSQCPGQAGSAARRPRAAAGAATAAPSAAPDSAVPRRRPGRPPARGPAAPAPSHRTAPHHRAAARWRTPGARAATRTRAGSAPSAPPMRPAPDAAKHSPTGPAPERTPPRPGPRRGAHRSSTRIPPESTRHETRDKTTQSPRVLSHPVNARPTKRFTELCPAGDGSQVTSRARPAAGDVTYLACPVSPRPISRRLVLLGHCSYAREASRAPCPGILPSVMPHFAA